MKIAIHHNDKSYSKYWQEYCIAHHLDYKMVNAYDTDIIQQVADCDIFMWHFHQLDYRDMLFAKQLLFSLEEAGKIVFPNMATGWHFDDKLGQKYLFEAMGIKAAPSFAFFDKPTAEQWAETATYPKVFKLRGGAGSSNVRLARNKQEAKHLIATAFSEKGFPPYQGMERVRRALKGWLHGEMSIRNVFAAFCRLFVKPAAYKLLPKQNGYAYFQEFIPNDGFDYRIEVAGDKAIAMVRYCRKNDFRASGGHNDHFEKELIPQDVIAFAFDVVDRLNMQAAALDIVRNNQTGELYVIEISYCYGVDDDEFEHGYWTRDGKWHNEPFNGIHWIIEDAIEAYHKKQALL